MPCWQNYNIFKLDVFLGAEHLGEMPVSRIAKAEQMMRRINKQVGQNSSTSTTANTASNSVGSNEDVGLAQEEVKEKVNTVILA